tara:strand:- start:71 stop:1381 length:1311 start_codon:yes stop_codon:yes gene_type:complete
MVRILNSTQMLLLCMLLCNSSYAQNAVSTTQTTQTFKDILITNAEKSIDSYYANQHKIKKLTKKLKPIKDKIKVNDKIISKNNMKIEKEKIDVVELEDSLIPYRKDIARLIKKLSKKDTIQLAKDTLKIKAIMEPIEKEISKKNAEIKLCNSQIKETQNSNITYRKYKTSLEKQIKVLDKAEIKQNYLLSKNKLQNFYKDSIEEFEFSYQNNNYLAFIADLTIHNIGMHLNYQNTSDHNATKYIKLSSVKTTLKQKGEKVLMLTNGGMYTPGNDPEGLLIANGKELEPIDLNTSKRMLNFYMMPNGVFYINDGKPKIETTKVFSKKYNGNQIAPDQATQSGPMLVINNKHHPAFNHGSSSKKLRSGVGIMKDGKVIFIISKNSISNFHDFGTIFKDVFGCENALFLDGAISKMYTKNYNKASTGGNFGPIISVTEK